MAGIEEVARRAGVSTATVSRALSGRGYVSEATKEKVAQAADELDYVVSSNASSLASGRMRNVGVVVPFLNHWFFASVIEGAESALLRQGYDLTLYNLTGGGEERKSVFDHFLLRQRVDAVIAIGLELTEAEVSSLHGMGKPLIGVGGPIAGVFSLIMDDAAVARLATEHLLGLGHSRIAHIGGGKEFDLDFHLPTNRRTGYERALRDAGVPVDASLFRPADFTLPGGYEAAKQLLGSPHNRPTAIVAASDEMAIGSILAARDLGLHVPQDVSIVGIDDHDLATFFGLTTVAQFPRRQGEQAVEALMKLLEPTTGEPASTDVPLPYELIVRSSTARPLA